MDAVVLAPMLGRPEAAARLAASLDASLVTATARLVFLVSPDDRDVHAACTATGADVSAVEWQPGPGDYARKINEGAALTAEPWLFTGSSDLRFHPGWLEEALRVGDGLAGVVGTNDLGNSHTRQGIASTHSLVAREYLPHAVIDQPGNLYFTGYDHNLVDVELVDYAKTQGRYRHARASVVEHLHHSWRKSPLDDTYRRGKLHWPDDQRLFWERRVLWRPDTARQAARRRVRSPR